MIAEGNGSAQERPKVLIADDHQLLLDALTEMMKEHFDVLAVDNSQEFLSAIDSYRPDVAILDISLPGSDGFVTARRALELQSSLPIVFLSMHTDTSYVDQAGQIGAKAYLSKQLSASEVLAAIHAVLNGDSLLARTSEAGAAAELTPRQQEVLRLIARGYTAKDIASQLKISVRTAEFHRSVIMQKLGLRSTAQMTRYAIAHGMT